jgi:Peptidase family M23
MNHGTLRRRRAGYSVRIAALVFLASVSKHAAQVVVPATASLDVHIPFLPTPVTIAGRSQLVYELRITNFRTVDVTLSRIEIIDAKRDLLARYEGSDLDARMTRIGTQPGRSDERIIGPGTSVVVFLWLPLDGDVPESVRHRLAYHLAGATDGNPPAAVEAAPINVRSGRAVALDAPLRDGPWVAIYNPLAARGHRRVLFAIDGRARIPARFAIDWVRLGDDGRPYHGDRSLSQNHYAYGADVLAVADGLVASVVDRYPEPTVPITLDNEAGNLIAIDLGGDRYAFYEHLQPGSIRVKVGDRVRRGQQLARVGASGSVFSGPHLHFHVSDANSPLASEGLPFMFRRFEVLGELNPDQAFGNGQPWRASGTRTRREMEMPAANSVVRF